MPRETEFEYLVVGGGTAGAVVAARLAEVPGVSVAVLEAGRPYQPVLDVPLVSLWAWIRKPDAYCWPDRTTPQRALDGREIRWPLPRIVGGGSAINAMIYSRGDPASYDRWRFGGRPEWGFRELLPYFLRAERFDGAASDHHGADGPLGVSATRHRNPLTDAFLEGCTQAGIARSDDLNGPGSEGAAYYHLSQWRGRRSSTATGYLRRSRATVLTETMAANVLFSGDRAVGVEARAGREVLHLTARREVILCAGVVRSPQILMLSGIGPAADLERVGVPVRVDRPGVGRNLRDHVRVPTVFAVAAPRPTRPLHLIAEGFRYLVSRRGLFASNVAEAAAVIRERPSDAVPSLRVVFRWRALPEQRGTFVDFEVVLIDPASVGRVTLASADPTAPMRIDPGYLSAPEDVERLVRGVRLARTIASAAACRRAGIGEEVMPGESEVEAHIRARADTAYHAVGTCRMGADPDAVVDAELRVIGVRGLRVVDASVMPTTVAGNANAAVVAIAERAAELIAGGRGEPGR